MRMIHQVLARHLAANTQRKTSIESLLDEGTAATPLVHLRHLLLWDKEQTLLCISQCADEINNRQFKFRTSGDWAWPDEEETAGARFRPRDLLPVLAELRVWVTSHPAWRPR